MKRKYWNNIKGFLNNLFQYAMDQNLIKKNISKAKTLKKIQKFAGHTSLKQTMDYIRVSDDDFETMQYLETLSSKSPDNIVLFKKEA